MGEGESLSMRWGWYTFYIPVFNDRISSRIYAEIRRMFESFFSLFLLTVKTTFLAGNQYAACRHEYNYTIVKKNNKTRRKLTESSLINQDLSG